MESLWRQIELGLPFGNVVRLQRHQKQTWACYLIMDNPTSSSGSPLVQPGSTPSTPLPGVQPQSGSRPSLPGVQVSNPPSIVSNQPASGPPPQANFNTFIAVAAAVFELIAKQGQPAAQRLLDWINSERSK